MTDTSSRHRPHESAAEAFSIEAEVVARPGQQHAIDEALRLLAAWAVRAARGQTSEPTSDPPRPPVAPEQHQRTAEEQSQ